MTCNEEGAAWACYGPMVPDKARRGSLGLTTWDHDRRQWTNPDMVQLAADSGIGVIVLSPIMMSHTEEPILLHEFLHAYHGKLMPNGFDNRGIKGFYAYAKSKDLLPKDTYALKNHQEFFAVTASIFLAGKDTVHEPNTRANLKEKLPGLLQISGRAVRVRPGDGRYQAARRRRPSSRGRRTAHRTIGRVNYRNPELPRISSRICFEQGPHGDIRRGP